MITLTRSQVRRLRAAFRRSILGITHRGIVSELVLRAEGSQLRAQHRYCDLAVECVETGNYRPVTSLADPARRPGRLRGRRRDARHPRVRRPGPHRRPLGGSGHPAEPRVQPHHARSTAWSRCRRSPATWASNPPELLEALAEATETGTPDSTRYALDMIQLQGTRGQIVATDGRQLLVRSGYRFRWPDDLLIKGRPIFACRALPRDQPVEVGRTDTHLFFRLGPWTISCAIQKDVRFPAVERVIPVPGEIVTRLRLDPVDARFLESALGRLPGGQEYNSPIIVDLNGEVAVRAAASDQPNQVTELVLNRSSYTGSPVCLCSNRALLERALRLGYTEFGFTDVESPFVCRDATRIYAVQPLSGASAPGADAEVTRIESGAASGGETRIATRTETTRRPMSERAPRNGHEPAPPAEGRNHTATRPAEAVGTAGSEQPGTSLAALMQEAESLHAALADAKSRTARLIAGLRRQRKQSRLVNETLKSLRQLKLVEAAG